ncbi:molecular chaperone HscC [Clostridium sp. MSJ-8]|uniref:molecular chaperone HscC n=1 Tax=Clostridium sp. MSJ-8 TaxID=2841510 RepID=UPI001C0F1145|nr:molecular chaperone HscC [Clostridium sp. MSJ-8]MBU5488850.1 molecular chaperone HscC [Clostridium sp. MSJ-8]
MAIVGIDLGTTNSLISCYTDNGVVVIDNSFGEKLTPSVVSVDENGQIFVGKIAKERQITHPNDSVSLFKRNMGSKKEYKLGDKNYLPEELSSFIIRSLKEDAEKFLGEEVEEAVISVPAYFNDTQRRATKRAGELAGLKVERLINEPTAAAIAYGLHEKNSNTKFLVFDLGGGTFDVSVLEIYRNIMEVRAVGGDNYLGGEDFTKVLIEIFARENNIELPDERSKEYNIIRKQAEIAKRAFSTERVVQMKAIVEEKEYSLEISINDYEKQCELLLSRLRKPIERALSDAAIKLSEIDTIVLVGGGTKLPIIRTFVSKLFGRLPATNIDPDEVVAMGAGIQAAMKKRDKTLKEIVLTDVCPFTLGTNTSVEKPGGYYESGHFFPIIERNTIIPVSRVERLYTVRDNQKKITVEILQGESRLAKDNILLGELSVVIPPSPKGEQAIDVRYTYDINGILEVEVTVVATGVKKSVIIEKNPGYMSKEEVKERLEELQSIKIHPKDEDANRHLIERGERLYEETIGDYRRLIDEGIRKFEEALDKQDKRIIETEYENLKNLLNDIEGEIEY